MIGPNNYSGVVFARAQIKTHSDVTAFADKMRRPDSIPFFGEDTRTSTGKYKCMWHWKWSTPTRTAHGITGWATVHASIVVAIENRSVQRFHLCAHNPCTGQLRNMEITQNQHIFSRYMSHPN